MISLISSAWLKNPGGWNKMLERLLLSEPGFYTTDDLRHFLEVH